MPLRSRTLTFLLICLPYFLNLGVSSLWDAGESLYAETSREMLETGDFLRPQFNYQPRTQKPPLTYWAIAASYVVFGVSEFSTRFPSALAVAGLFLFMVLALPRIKTGCAPLLIHPKAQHAHGGQEMSGGKDPFTVETLLLAAGILATMPRFFIVARRLPIDCLFTVFLSISLLCAMWGSCRATVAARSEGGIFIWAAAGFFAGLAVLTKGPVAIVIELLVFTLVGSRERRWPWKGYLAWAGVIVLVLAPYYAALLARGESAALWSFLLKENLGRYASDVFGPSRSVFYYFQVLAADAFPWSWFLPAMVYFQIRSGKSAGVAQDAVAYVIRFSSIWFLTIFVLFSLSRNKQEYYILPAYPAAAILLALYFQKESPGKPDIAFKVSTRVLGVALLVFAIAAAWSMASTGAGLVSWLIPALLLAGAFALWLRAGVPARAAGILAMFLLLVMVNVCVTLLPWAENFRPTKKLTERISQSLQPPDQAGYFRHTSPSMAFYLKRPVLELYQDDDLQKVVEQPGRLFLLMDGETYENLPQHLKSRFAIAASAPQLPTRARGFVKFVRTGELPRILAVAEY